MKPIASSLVLLTSTLVLSTGVALAQSMSPESTPATPPDNTKSNADPSNRSPSADQQTNQRSDVDIAGAIRRDVIQDKSLSTNAHNAKIVAVNGTVTLNGVVDTSAERSALEQIATNVAGAGRVVNQLKVKGQ